MAPHHPRLCTGVPRDLAPSIQGWPGHRGGSGGHPLPLHGPHPPSDEDKPPELVMALLPSLVRTMLAAFVEVMAAEV
jgi:hypothetical protein